LGVTRSNTFKIAKGFIQNATQTYRKESSCSVNIP